MIMTDVVTADSPEDPIRSSPSPETPEHGVACGAAALVAHARQPGALPSQPGCAYEFTWDGVRAVAAVDRGRVAVASRTDRDVSRTYPELTGLADLLRGRRAIVDGEIVAVNSAGVPSLSGCRCTPMVCALASRPCLGSSLRNWMIRASTWRRPRAGRDAAAATAADRTLPPPTPVGGSGAADPALT